MCLVFLGFFFFPPSFSSTFCYLFIPKHTLSPLQNHTLTTLFFKKPLRPTCFGITAHSESGTQ